MKNLIDDESNNYIIPYIKSHTHVNKKFTELIGVLNENICYILKDLQRILELGSDEALREIHAHYFHMKTFTQNTLHPIAQDIILFIMYDYEYEMAKYIDKLYNILKDSITLIMQFFDKMLNIGNVDLYDNIEVYRQTLRDNFKLIYDILSTHIDKVHQLDKGHQLDI